MDKIRRLSYASQLSSKMGQLEGTPTQLMSVVLNGEPNLLIDPPPQFFSASVIDNGSRLSLNEELVNNIPIANSTAGEPVCHVDGISAIPGITMNTTPHVMPISSLDSMA